MRVGLLDVEVTSEGAFQVKPPTKYVRQLFVEERDISGPSGQMTCLEYLQGLGRATIELIGDGL